MPRDLLRRLFDERDAAHKKEIHGEMISRFIFNPFDPAGTLMATADVRISGSIVSAVPLAANNRDLIYANPGTSVTLSRSETGRLEVTGLSKRGYGNIYTYSLVVPVITPMNSNTGSALTAGAVTSVAVSGFSVSVATLGELASATSGGFGETPLQALLLRDAGGTILNVIA